MEIGKPEGQLKGWEVMDFAVSLEHGKEYRSAGNHLREAGEKIAALTDMVSKEASGLAKLENEVRSHCIEAGSLATSFITQTDNGFHAGLGFLLHGIGLNVLSSLEALIVLSGRKGLEELTGISGFVSECFTTFFESKHENLGKIERERENILSSVSDRNVVEIINATFHTTRILRKVFPK
jgi:hypothetical protein